MKCDPEHLVPILDPDQRVAVVGGGVVGLSLARELAGRGVRVTVYDAGDLPGGSKGAVGLLSTPTPNKLSAYSRLCREGYETYEAWAGELLAETGIDIEYSECGSLRLFDEPPPRPERMVESWNAAGAGARWLEPREISVWIPDYAGPANCALRLEREAMIDPRRLLDALHASCIARGVTLRNSRVSIVDCDGAIALECGGDSRCERGAAVVLAAGSWSTRLSSHLEAPHVDVHPIRGQAGEILRDPPRCIVHHYLPGEKRSYHLLPRGDRVWIGSTSEDVGFDGGTNEEARIELLAAARRVYPSLDDSDLLGTWAGLRPRARRLGGPYLGHQPGKRNLWLACGHFRIGVLTAPSSSRWLADAMLLGQTIDNDFGLPGTHGH